MLVLQAFLISKADAQHCDLGGLVLAFWHLGGSLWYLGGTLGDWEQWEGHVGVWSRSDFGTIWELHFESFLGTDGSNYVLWVKSGCQGLLKARFSN